MLVCKGAEPPQAQVGRWERLEQNCNEGAGGDIVHVAFRRADKDDHRVVVGLKLFHARVGKVAEIKLQPGFELLDGDLNSNAGRTALRWYGSVEVIKLGCL